MELFIDTANIDEIREINSLGLLAGVTTNPSLIAREGRVFEEVIKEIAAIVDGPISAEVISLDADGMVEEALKLSEIDKNIVIKIPMTMEGLKATNILNKKSIKTNVTLIFSAEQALLAGRAGATYVSPFIGRLDDIGIDGVQVIEDISNIFKYHKMETKIIAASIRNNRHVLEAGLKGAHIATIPYKIFKTMSKHPLTDKGIEMFLQDWRDSINE